VKLDATVTFRDESKQLSLDTKACKLPDGTDVVCTELNACLEYSGVGVDRKLGWYQHNTSCCKPCMVVHQILVPVTSINSFPSDLFNSTVANSGCSVLLYLQIFGLRNFIFMDTMKHDPKFRGMNQKFALIEILDKY
jgi:hypothetical protein